MSLWGTDSNKTYIENNGQVSIERSTLSLITLSLNELDPPNQKANNLNGLKTNKQKDLVACCLHEIDFIFFFWGGVWPY